MHTMASSLTLSYVSASENEFLAKGTLIDIISGLKHPEFKFTSGTFGPLEAGEPCEVPLWFAIQLRCSGKCTIVIPKWLHVENLKEKLEIEKSMEDNFTDLPYHYVEISKLLLTHAKEDFDSPDEVGTLVRDLENVRMDRMLGVGILGKMANSLARDESTRNIVNFVNLSAMELLTIRQYLSGSLAFVDRLNGNQDQTRLNVDGGDTARPKGTSRRTLRRLGGGNEN